MAGHPAQLVPADLLPFQGLLPQLVIDPGLHSRADQVRRSARFQGIQFPTVVPILLLVARVPGVRRLGRVGRRIVLLDLVPRQGNAVTLTVEPNNCNRS